MKFENGYNRIVGEQQTGFDFGVRVMKAGDVHREKTAKETFILLLSGSVEVVFNDKKFNISRKNVFEDSGKAFLFPSGIEYEITAKGDAELTEIRVENENKFEPRFFENVQGARFGKPRSVYERIVTTYVDYEKVKESKLVVGEVLHPDPFRTVWSSYPPHSHEHIEVYFYKFMPEQGFGFSEAGGGTDGRKPKKVVNNDFVIIPGNACHSQVSAPGYKMWYLWIMKHLPNNPWTCLLYTSPSPRD